MSSSVMIYLMIMLLKFSLGTLGSWSYRHCFILGQCSWGINMIPKMKRLQSFGNVVVRIKLQINWSRIIDGALGAVNLQLWSKMVDATNQKSDSKRSRHECILALGALPKAQCQIANALSNTLDFDFLIVGKPCLACSNLYQQLGNL